MLSSPPDAGNTNTGPGPGPHDHAGAGLGSDSFDGLATPLHDVTFCVVDVETTGGSPASCALTEIGAARYRSGECLGTFQTLVNPGVPVPPAVTVLTGITEAMVLPAPPVAEVLPALLEFVGGAVLVGHNLRFDVAFLDAALAAHGRPVLRHHRVDTVALARRLVRDDVPDCRLATLAELLRLAHRPTHRALDDALATADLLHWLLERAGTFGATGLDDLLVLPRLVAHPQAAKLRLTVKLPRAPGAYVFRDRQGRPLHVGAATDVRRRARSYFAGQSGQAARRAGALLREAHAIEAVPCRSTLEAAVLAVRLTHTLEPRHDRPRGRGRAYRYVTLVDRPTPRLAVTRRPRDSALHLGPLVSTAVARQVVAAIESALSPAPGGDLVELVTRGLGDEPHLLLDPLARRIRLLAATGQHEQAATVRDQSAALAGALRQRRCADMLRRAGRVVVDEPGGGGTELLRGRLVRAWGAGGAGAGSEPHEPVPVEPPPLDGPVPAALADELACVGTWLDRHAHRLRLRLAEGGLSSPLPRLRSPPPVTGGPPGAPPAGPARRVPVLAGSP